MNRQVSKFINGNYNKGSYEKALQKFLLKKCESGVSIHSVERLYFNLRPVGKAWGEKPFADLYRPLESVFKVLEEKP